MGQKPPLMLSLEASAAALCLEHPGPESTCCRRDIFSMAGSWGGDSVKAESGSDLNYPACPTQGDPGVTGKGSWALLLPK